MSTGGNSESYNGAPTPQGSYIENTIIIQYDPLLQEVWDQTLRLETRLFSYLAYEPDQVCERIDGNPPNE